MPALITWLHIDFMARQHASVTLRVTVAGSFLLLSDLTWLHDVLGSAMCQQLEVTGALIR